MSAEKVYFYRRTNCTGGLSAEEVFSKRESVCREGLSADEFQPVEEIHVADSISRQVLSAKDVLL